MGANDNLKNDQDAQETSSGTLNSKCTNPECKCTAQTGSDCCCQICGQIAQESESKLCECGHPECSGPLR